VKRLGARRRPARIVILGAGGNSLAIVDAILAANQAARGGPVYEIAGFLDDLPVNRGAVVAGFPVLGPIADARKLRGCHFVNGIASVESFRMKRAAIERAGVPPERFETIVHPRAVVAASAVVGCGCAIMAGSAICPDARVEDHVIILQNSSINHHACVGRYATVSAGVTVLGYVTLGEESFVSGGAALAPYVKVGAGALVGLGAVVIRDVAAGSVVVGNPARRIASRYAAVPAPSTALPRPRRR